MPNDWVATVIIQSNNEYSNEERMNALFQIIDSVIRETTGDGVILFPGGWFSANEKGPKVLYNWVEENVKNILMKIERNIIVCLGIDGRENEYKKDQIGVAISKNGIIAIGRKFHPAPFEKGHVELAKDCFSKEDDKSRTFTLNGKKYFICACYDSFGIKQLKIPNFGINVILDLVHGFYPKDEGNSGAEYFAKNGFAGASKHWNCLVFGAAVFFRREIPKRWPSGVYWNQGNKSTREWKYNDNPIKESKSLLQNIREGKALIRIFDVYL
jgi:hypothetical protein